MSGTVLLTLGRLPKCLDIARGFHRLGWRVVVAEPFSWHLTATSRAVAKCYKVTPPEKDPLGYRADLLDVVAWEQPRLVMPISEEALYVAPLAARLPPGSSLFAPDFETLAALHDKWHFARKAAELGLTVPDSAPGGTPEASAIAAGGDYVAKPRHSCSGLGLHYHSAGDPPPDDPAILVQRKVEGTVHSSFSLVHDGKVGISVLYRGLVFDGTVAVCFERIDMPPAVAEWIERFAGSVGYTGFLAFDFIIDEDGRVHAIECNPRTTSGMHFLDAKSVIAAVLDPDRSAEIALKPYTVMQQFYPVLTATQAAFGDWNRYRHNAAHLFKARDVTWEGGDPMPFLLMTLSSMTIIMRAMRNGTTLGEAAMSDLVWRPNKLTV